MAVVSVQERHERRRSTYRDGKITHIRVFLVTTDDIGDGTAAALTAKGVPQYHEFWKGTSFIWVTGLDVEPVQNSGLHSEVQVEYTSLDPTQPDDDPLNRPTEYSWGSSEATEPYFIDESTSGPGGKPVPVVNSAGDAFEAFMQRESGELTITVTRNEATHDAADADTYSHTTNLAAVKIDGTTFAKGTLKLSPIQAQKITEKVKINGIDTPVTYYKRTYNLKARRDGWHDKPLDVGTNELVPDTSGPNKPKKLKSILDSSGLALTKPWPLDGNGRKKPNATDTPAVLDFQPYKEKDWQTLAIHW